jgi:hypothetical protein
MKRIFVVQVISNLHNQKKLPAVAHLRFGNRAAAELSPAYDKAHAHNTAYANTTASEVKKIRVFERTVFQNRGLTPGG